MRTVLTLALQTSTITLMGIGVTFTIITGGIDLSIGSVVAFSGTVAVMVYFFKVLFEVFGDGRYFLEVLIFNLLLHFIHQFPTHL